MLGVPGEGTREMSRHKEELHPINGSDEIPCHLRRDVVYPSITVLWVRFGIETPMDWYPPATETAC